MVDIFDMLLAVPEQLAAVETRIRRRHASLADEIGRAADALALHVREARQRTGRDRAESFRCAASSASELTLALRIARARGCLTLREFTAIDAALDWLRASLRQLARQVGAWIDGDS